MAPALCLSNAAAAATIRKARPRNCGWRAAAIAPCRSCADLVDSPRNYPISKYNLGLCLLDLAAADHDAAQAARQRQEGASWIVRAADGGFGNAEAKAVTLYLDGVGVAADPVEAEKWALIYHGNGMRFALGLPDIDSAVRDRLDATLTMTTCRGASARRFLGCEPAIAGLRAGAHAAASACAAQAKPG